MARMTLARRLSPLVALALSACGGAPAVVCPATPPVVGQRHASFGLPPPAFTDPARREKLAAAFPDIEAFVEAEVARLRLPGAAVGIVVDGELAYAKGFGVANVVAKTPVTRETVFRIASLTKSFTAMAILQLRDEGKLSLDDPAALHVPELASLAYPTRDAPLITIRHLLTHGAGFPEDNPWGDRQLDLSDEAFVRLIQGGIPFSTSPASAFEYSNFGFALLGRVVGRVSGLDYADHLRTRILSPLGMHATVLDERMVEKGRLARGYRLENEALVEEKNLAHGAFGAMGGLYSSLDDLARYVAFHLSAWPPRDDREVGPLRRSSVREMHGGGRSVGLWTWPGPEGEGPRVISMGYGFGLGAFATCEFESGVSHTGGLPGYGSVIQFLPHHGVGVIALANLTYAPMAPIGAEILHRLHATGALAPRAAMPSKALLQAKGAVARLVTAWSDPEADATFAPSFFLDKPRPKLRSELDALRASRGACSAEEGIIAENALRGKFVLACERGFVEASITLAPTTPPRVQHLALESVESPAREPPPRCKR